MNDLPTVISYRSCKDHSSHFLNVEEIIKSRNLGKISQIYEDIFLSVTAYELDHADSLKKVEGLLYDRIFSLQMEEKKNLKNKLTGWKSILLGFLTLGIRPLVIIFKREQIASDIDEFDVYHKKFSKALFQMNQRVLEKELHPQATFMQELKSQRLSQQTEELVRLKSIPRIATSLEKVSQSRNKYRPLTTSQQVAFGRSLELREKLKETHYVINHGQNLELMALSILTRKLKQEFEPKFYESFEPLRHETSLGHIKEDSHTIAWYQQQLSNTRTSDHEFRRELLCGDCVLESVTLCESALDFFSGTANIPARGTSSFFYNLLVSVAQDYMTNQTVVAKLCHNLVELMSNHNGGNLYSICVPKEKFAESCYFSRAFGRPLENQEDLIGKMEEMQAGDNPHGYPQIRILTHKIRAEEGFHVILNSTLKDEQLLLIEAKISLCIQAALVGYRISI